MSMKLSDHAIELVSKLTEIQNNRVRMDSRIELYEKKIGLIKNALISSNKEEMDIINKLYEEGYLYGNNNKTYDTKPTVNDDTKEQLFAMFNDFLASRSGNDKPDQHTQVPTSAPIYTSKSTPYTFPESMQVTPLISPTSGPSIRAIPIGVSPTSH